MSGQVVTTLFREPRVVKPGEAYVVRHNPDGTASLVLVIEGHCTQIPSKENEKAMTDKWDGQPQKPDHGLAHQLENQRGDVRFVALWCEQDQMWAFPDGTMHGPSRVTHLRYLGPCLTPAEVAAAVMAERERCAKHLENGNFLHDDAPIAKMARECATAIRKQPVPEGADAALAAVVAAARREGIEAAAQWHDAEAAACDAHIAQMSHAVPGGGCLSLVSQLRERARLHRADAISIRALLPAPPDVAQTSGKKVRQAKK